ncbi:MAG: hypothetical protein JOY90_33030 [Bradyrhizobium sp.]|uniref:hypothetical protein n=1 Tax=Bradyrhizobium sp. TaxID=376 RepID=UPI001DAC4310|nr:hypothetical protein [Bradyrhizobium sp.]MBV9565239.1 hypothetical protein [Bradyrhizobium sp.]
MKRGSKTPDPKGLGAMQVRASSSSLHLAHWPPPNREHISKPVLSINRPGEPVERHKGRGWRLTRAMFAEFEGEES